MNGGVSLAVWMGGVTTEIDRLRRGVGAYGEILDLTCSTPRIDVITGASAGGINGAVLAAAIGRDGQALEGIRELWVRKGGLGALLRSPFEADPPSLMRGDEYFYKQLRTGFDRVSRPRPSDPATNPMRLTLLTATLQATDNALVDDFGTPIPDVTHIAELAFRRDRNSEGQLTDDWLLPDLADRLALAARCSASFPGAFEASYCPVGEEIRGTPRRPDMALHASFSSSRFTVDGGTVMNKPFAPALRSIYEQPATPDDDQIRRVLLYVVPDPGDGASARREHITEDQPTLANTVLSSLVTMPRAESVARELRDMRAHNTRVSQLARTRRWLLLQDPLPLSTQLFPAYLFARTDESVERILEALDRRALADGMTVRRHTRSTLREALRTARTALLPSPLDPVAPTLQGTWRWGIAPLERAAMTVLALLREAFAVAGFEDPELRQDLRRHRAAVHEHMAELRSLRYFDDTFWEDQLAEVESSSHPTGWAAEAFARWERAASLQTGGDGLERLHDLGRALAATLQGARASLLRAAEAAGERWADPALDLRSRVTTLCPAGTSGDPEVTLTRLLALDVALVVFARGAPTYEQAIEVMLVSANTPNAFDGRSRVEDKLAGTQLGHFGGFYKPSWRANDWAWGRLDGAYRLVQMLLAPPRLAQLGLSAAEAFDSIRQIALATAPQRPDDDLRAALADPEVPGWDPVAVQAELAFLDDPAQPFPAALPACAMALARRVQAEIVRDEVPAIVEALGLDDQEGADPTPSGAILRASVAQGPPGVGRSIAAFRSSEIGVERIADDIGSNLFTGITSRAAAVAISVASGRRSGLGPARSIVGALRTLALSFYVVTQSAVKGGKAAFALTTTLGLVGAFMVTTDFAVEGDLANGVTSVGFALLLAMLVLAGVQSGSPLGIPALVALTGLAAAAPFLLIQDGTGEFEGIDDWRTVARPVLSLVALAVVPLLAGQVGSRWRRWRRSRAVHSVLTSTRARRGER